MENVLELTHLKKYYGQTRAVEDVSFSVKPGEVVVIIGPSGAGKSTVLRCINRMIDPTEGTILFQGTDMAQVKRERDLKAIRRRIGMIFQSFNLVYRLSVFQNVLHGRLGYMSTPNAVLGRYSEARMRNIGCIVNLHQVDVAKTYGDRIVGIHQGRVVFDGPPQELTNSMIETIYDAPIEELTVGLEGEAAHG